MADTKRDIELRIAATTSGSDQVKQLTKQLDDLAKEGGLAAPEFKKLADELRKLGEQVDVVQALDSVEQKVSETGASLTDAKAKVDTLTTALDKQRATTNDYAQALQTAQQAVRSTEDRVRDLEAAQRTLRAETDRSDKATVGYRDKARALATELATLRNALADQKVALRDAKTAYDEQASALSKVESQTTAANRAADAIAKTLTRQTAEADKAKQALGEMGNSSTSAADALTKVEAAIDGVRKSTIEMTAAQAKADAYIKAVAASNESASQQAVAAARARAAAAKAAGDADAAAAREAEFALLKLKLAEEEAGNSAREAAAAQRELNDAFGKAGVRSAALIQAEIDGISKALVRIKGDASVTAEQFDRAFRTAQVRVAALEAELQGLNPTLQRTTTLGGMLRQSLSQLTAAFGAFELGRGFLNAVNQLETLRRSLTLITGSSETAAQQIEFLKNTADKAGLSYNALAQDFINFSAAANSSGIALSQQQAVFESVALAAGQLGLSTDRVGLILQALAQTASKGKVSLEELQGQLGESLPGALAIVAKGFGVTKAELLELVKSGVDADRFFQAFSKGVSETFGNANEKVNSLANTWARFTNLLSDISGTLSAAGALDALKGLLVTLTVVISPVVLGISALIDGLFTLARMAAVTVAALNSGDGLTGAMRAVQAEFDAMNERQVKLQQSLFGFITGTDRAAAAQRDLAGASAQGAAAQGSLAASTNQSAASANAAGQSWAQLALAYARAKIEAENQVKVSEALAQAKKIEGDARQAIIAISGNEVAKLAAASEAAKAEADALANVSTKRQAEITVLQQQLDALTREVAIRGDKAGTISKEIEEIGKLIEAKTAEGEKAKQAAELAKIEAAARSSASQSYADNADKLRALKSAYDESRLALEAAQQAEQRGLVTKEQVREAALRAAQAEGLYRDALRDSTQALEIKTRLAQGALSVTEAQINLERAKIETEIANARAIGDTYTVQQKSVELKQLDIKLAQAKIEALRIEAEALRESAKAELEAAQATGELTKAKQAEIDLRLKNAQIKDLEAQRSGEAIKQIQAEIEAMRQRGTESGNTAAAYVNHRQSEAAAMDDVTAATQRAIAAERERQNVDASGFVKNTAGQTVNAAIPTWTSIYNQAKAGGLTDEQAKQLASEFAPNGKVPYEAGAAQMKYGGPYSTLPYAVERAIEQRLMGVGLSSGASLSGGGGSSGSMLGQSGSGDGGLLAKTPVNTSSARSVNITINGRSYGTVNTASDSDAQRLTSILQILAEAANRSN